MLPAYVLGALETEEMLAVDNHLQHNRKLLLQLERLETTAVQLALSAPQAEAPSQAKRTLMARVRADVAEQPKRTVSIATTDDGAETITTGKPAPRRLSWLDALREQLGSSLPGPVLTAAVVGIALLLLGYTGLVQSRLNRLAGELDTVQETLAALRIENGQLLTHNTQLQQQLQQRENQLTQFAGASRVIALEGTEEAPAASGSFHVGPQSSVLVLRGLAPLPKDQTYELWLIPSDGAPVPSGLVEVDEQGAATFTVSMADLPTDFAAIGVSIEPAGGSPQPTGPIVLLGTSAS